jgi:hypothetical protein
MVSRIRSGTILLLLFVIACSAQTPAGPSPIPVMSPTPLSSETQVSLLASPTPTETQSATPTETSSPTETSLPTPTASPSSTTTPTITPRPTRAASLTPAIHVTYMNSAIDPCSVFLKSEIEQILGEPMKDPHRPNLPGQTTPFCVYATVKTYAFASGAIAPKSVTVQFFDLRNVTPVAVSGTITPGPYTPILLNDFGLPEYWSWLSNIGRPVGGLQVKKQAGSWPLLSMAMSRIRLSQLRRHLPVSLSPDSRNPSVPLFGSLGMIWK